MKHVKWILITLLLVPVSALTLYKPSRVLAPELFGVSCHANNICVDDITRLAAASALLDDARHYLATQWGLSIATPRIILCSTDLCQKTFGLSRRAGVTVSFFGILIAPRGWERHYVAHELIHYWQAETLGPLTGLTGEPWLTEGMAYALSGDPRETLQEPFESYRRRFNEWHRLQADAPLKDALAAAL